jgi:molybdopterin-guanine dinucleotide biosynthesis protein A
MNDNSAPLPSDIVAVILAGGQARRMGGGDKTLIDLGGKTILQHILDRLRPQCAHVIINANGDLDRFTSFGCPVVADQLDGFLGPLAGILAGMDAAATRYPYKTHILSLAGDTPFIPFDLAERMCGHASGDNIVCANSQGRTHPVFGLWPIAIRSELRDQLINHDIRKIDRFTADYDVQHCEFAGVPDPFFNINTVEDKEKASHILSRA